MNKVISDVDTATKVSTRASIQKTTRISEGLQNENRVDRSIMIATETA
jgi:hypothetical protein